MARWFLKDKRPTPHFKEEGIQAHLNFWKLPECKALDIGIDFPFMKAGKVNIFIATEKNVDVENITYLLKDADILNIVFNEFVDTETCPDKTKCLKAARRAHGTDDSYTFCLRCLEKPVSVQNASEYGGKLIELDAANTCGRQCGCGRQYVRLRLTGDAITESYRKEILHFTRFEYYTSRLECLDFRLNNVRSLPEILVEERKPYPRLDKVRCFLMLESSEKLVLSKENYKTVRPLEKEKWARYIAVLASYVPSQEKAAYPHGPQGKKEKKAILAYQWNSDRREQQNFSLFIEIKNSAISLRTCILLLLVTICLGIASSLMAPAFPVILSFLCDLVKALCDVVKALCDILQVLCDKLKALL